MEDMTLRHSCSQAQRTRGKMAEASEMLAYSGGEPRPLCAHGRQSKRPLDQKGGIREGEVPEMFVVWDQVRNRCLSNVTL